MPSWQHKNRNSKTGILTSCLTPSTHDSNLNNKNIENKTSLGNNTLSNYEQNINTNTNNIIPVYLTNPTPPVIDHSVPDKYSNNRQKATSTIQHLTRPRSPLNVTHHDSLNSHTTTMTTPLTTEQLSLPVHTIPKYSDNAYGYPTSAQKTPKTNPAPKLPTSHLNREPEDQQDTTNTSRQQLQTNTKDTQSKAIEMTIKQTHKFLPQANIDNRNTTTTITPQHTQLT